MFTDEKEVVKRVILTPKDESNVSWEIRGNDVLEDLYYFPERKQELVFNRAEWDMQVETGPSEKYTMLIDLLGEEKAREAWQVLFG